MERKKLNFHNFSCHQLHDIRSKCYEYKSFFCKSHTHTHTHTHTHKHTFVLQNSFTLTFFIKKRQNQHSNFCKSNKMLCRNGTYSGCVLTNRLTQWNRLLPQSRNSPYFMEPEVWLPLSEDPAIWPCPEPNKSNSCPPTHFLKIHFNIILPPTCES